jgi:hypothetical protein
VRKKYTRKQLIAASNAVGYSFDNDVGLFDSVQKYKADPELAINLGLKGQSKSKKTERFLGCTFEETMVYLEKSFRPPMTRENMGKIWHVDHIRPVCSFDLSDPEQVKACFHYTNLQPLFVEENLKKSGKY